MRPTCLEEVVTCLHRGVGRGRQHAQQLCVLESSQEETAGGTLLHVDAAQMHKR